MVWLAAIAVLKTETTNTNQPLKSKIFMKKLLLILFYFLLLQAANAQTDKSWQSGEIFLGYTKVAFLNPTFSQNYNKGLIKDLVLDGGVSFELGGRAIHRYFMFSGSFFQSYYK